MPNAAQQTELFLGVANPAAASASSVENKHVSQKFSFPVIRIEKNNYTEYLFGEIYQRASMKGLTAAGLESPPLSKWNRIIRRVPIYLAPSATLKLTPHQYPTIQPIKLTRIVVSKKDGNS